MTPWVKSSTATSERPAVQVRKAPGGVLIRALPDEARAVVYIPRLKWVQFVEGVKAGDFDDLPDLGDFDAPYEGGG